MRIEFASVDPELAPADDAARLCFSRLRFIPTLLKEKLQREGLWDDLVQETYLTAWEAWEKELSETETRRLMARRLYAFLKSYGYRVYRHGYYKLEIPLSAIAQDEEFEAKILTIAINQPALTFMGGDDHMGEKILALLQKSAGGLSKRDLYTYLCISGLELDWHCVPLIKKGLILEVKRESSTRGRPPTPLLVAVQPGQTLPTPPMGKMERIRQAYFLEGKGIKRIAREFHHSKQTVRKAIRAEG